MGGLKSCIACCGCICPSPASCYCTKVKCSMEPTGMQSILFKRPRQNQCLSFVKKWPCSFDVSDILTTMDCKACAGRCVLFLVLAVVCDVVGLVLFLVGIFAPLSFWDFFVLSGSLIVFLSLAFWIFWYLGNLTVPYKELLPL